ncbi:YDG domain-containing protein [Glaciimonas immobilis]|uniref:Filamentous hemagglutinin family protein n=1 Tax=Glaciimonas immobilis TaxID=728004 RepID=A0A840RQ63_9BURK|nr:YDG domain-containing protein [Glaciimonas immobilis]KAF3998148.1 filamentous hemagglutinin N-terminal domain-containing protein [Glaciimonas immobilis]MBB5199146.1 filamentous hemagglutinin family protein [Glaciimonas immobilis]
MNNIYRLVWNRAINQWIVAGEFARSTQRGASRTGRTGRACRRTHSLGTVVLSLSLSLASIAQAAPFGAQITSGSGVVSHTATTTTIQQSSQNLALNWQSFNVAAGESVNFVQPGTTSIAVNRIKSSSASEIFGHLNANGQVWLINPNGILFGQSAQVNVGGLVASTLEVADSAVGANAVSFSGAGIGAIVNKGTLTATGGGYVALLGNTVSNQGVITAALGTVALAGGNAATLTFSANQLLHLQVDQSTLNNLVENNQLIQADGGQVSMTAGAKNSVLASAVNNTGIIYARSVNDHNGVITLLGGMQAGQVNVGGTLDASAPNGGHGGAIETSAGQIKIADNAIITASARQGKSGTWLIDPTNLTIDTSAAAAIASALTLGTNVTEQTGTNGASGTGTQAPGAGDINVNAAINWSNPTTTLTLSAHYAINVNAAVHGSGTVVMDAIGGNLTIASGASISGNAGVRLATGANFINQAGAAAVTAPGSRWLVYSTSAGLDTTGGLTSDFLQYAAPYQTTPVLAAGNAFLYSATPSLRVSALAGGVSKTYDGNASASLTASNVSVTGLINGDSLVSMAGTYGSSDAGVNMAVTSSTGAAEVLAKNASGIAVYGYGVSGPGVSALIGTITPAVLGASIIGTPAKVYDGTTTATLSASNYLLSGFVTGQTATVNQPSSIAYGGSDAGTQTLTASFSSPNFSAGSGTNLLNYILPASATGAGVIWKAPLEVTGVLSSDKIYNGSSANLLNIANAGLYGIIPADVNKVSLVSSGASGQFSSPDAGNKLAVSVSGFTLSGASAGNYQIVEPSNLVASITPKSLMVTGVTTTNKVYDATRLDTLVTNAAVLSGIVLNDAVVLSSSNATGTFASPNVGNALAINASGFAIAGSAASNYQIVQPLGLVADITPAALAIALTGNPTKVYNGSLTATPGSANFSVSGFMPGEAATVLQTSSATYSTANAGTQGVHVTLSSPDFAAAGNTLLSNYTFPTTVNGSGIITPAPLVVGIINNPVKVYDGTTTSTLSSASYGLSGFVVGQSATVNHANASYASADVGIQAMSTRLVSADYTAAPGTLLSNYLLPGSVAGFGTITPLPILMSVHADIVNNPSKFYDGTSLATLSASNYSLTGFVSGQGATVTQSTGHYVTVNAGTQPVSAALTNADFTANSGTNLNNYTLPTTAYGTGTITPVALSVAIVNSPTKTYNGVTTGTLSASNYLISGFIGNESAQINQSALINYSGTNVGNQTITATLMSSDYTPNGALLTNYVLPATAFGAARIAPASIFVTGVLATDKVYNTTTANALNTARALLNGVVASDVANIVLVDGSAIGIFSNANVGSNLAVRPAGFSISGSALGNYVLQPITGLTANITAAPLHVTGVSANNKPYDNTSAATLNDASAILSGVLSGTAGPDNVTLTTTGVSGAFGSVNVGQQLTVSASGFSLSGAQAGNYVLSQPTGLAADITPAPIIATIIGNPTKAYSGSSSVTLTAANYTLSGFVAGQNATLPQSATASYVAPDAGTNVGITSTLVLPDFLAKPGTQLSNYALPSTGTGTGTITPALLTAIIIGNPTKTYDSTTSAALTSANYQLSGFVGSQGGTVSQSVGSYAAPGAGGEPVSASLATNNFVSAAGTNLNNYILPISASGNGTITPASLTVLNVHTTDRVYNGSTTDALTGATLSGTLYGSDVTQLANFTTGTLGSSGNAGKDSVTTAMTLTGPGSSNYQLIQPTGLTALISPATLSATSVASRAYDGTNVADLSAANTTFSGFISGQGASVNSGVTGTYSQANVGNNLVISAGPLTTGNLIANIGTLLTNYTLPTSDNGIGNITPAILRYVATPATYQYGLSIPGVQAGTVTGFVHNESVNSATTGILAFSTTANSTTNVGSYAITGSGLSANNGNYSLIQAPSNDTALTITPAPLTVINVVTSPRVYNGTTVDTLTGATLSGTLYNRDTPTLGNAGTGILGNYGNVGTDTVTTAMTVTGTSGGNYAITQPAGLTAVISPAALTATSNATKVYDSTTIADLSGTHTVLSGFVVGQGASVTTGVTGTFSQANVGSSLNISSGALSASNLVANAGTLLTNYTLPASDNGSGSITPKVLDLSGTRVYDGLADASASVFTANGLLAGVNKENLSLSGSGTLVSKSVGQRNIHTLDTLTIVSGTGTASNYTLVGGTDSVIITPLAVTVSAVGQNKVYDATTATNVILGSTGVFAADIVHFNDASATFATKDVGQQKAVSVTGITAGGTDAGNYTFNPTATTAANITPLTIVVNATGIDKVYNANATAGVSLASAGIYSGDQVAFAGTAATFTDKNVGQVKTVNVSGISASGNDASNYVISNSTAVTTANITPYAITVNALGHDKVYNANAIDTVSLSSTGVLGTDVVNFAANAASFIDKNVAQHKNVSVTGITIGGTDASNYSINNATTTTANITPLRITVNALGTNKIYDANTTDVVTLGSTGVLDHDVLTFSNLGANFIDKNVGQSKLVNVTGISASGSDVNNYVINTATTTRAAITPLAITVSATGTDKVYDGTMNAAVTLSSNGVIGTDNVTFAALAANFNNKNVGQQKTVNLSGIADSGIDAGNYLVNSTATATASITPAIVNLSGTRFIDGTSTAKASIFGASGIVSGVKGETLTLTGSGTLAGKELGTQPLVGFGNLALADGAGLASNYTLIGGIDSATIIPAPRPMMLVAFIESFINTDNAIPTPYGVGVASAVANFTGNHKKNRYNPIEANGTLADFKSGLDLQVLESGVRLPNGVEP